MRCIGWRQIKLFGLPAFQVLAAIVLTVMLGITTAGQTAHWASDLLLYYRGVTIAPNNDIAKNNLATELEKREMYDEAITLYEQVIARNPSYWLASYNLGYVYYKLGRYEESERSLRLSLDHYQLDPDQFTRLAQVCIKTGQLDEAAGLMRHAIEMRPRAYGYHYALGIVLKQKGETEGAISEFEAELVNNPDQSAARDQIVELKSKMDVTGHRR
jgi:tetratricopeptide (TPR) repeat protein